MSLPPCALCRFFRFEPFLLSGDFSILLRNHHSKFFFAFFSCVSVDIKLFTLSIRQFRRVTAFPFVFTDLEYTSCSGAADFRLFRLEFRRLWRFYRLVGCLLVLTDTDLVSPEASLNFVGCTALHIVGYMGVYIQGSEHQKSSHLMGRL